jgi:uncharacterized protein (DUF1697 family)
MANLNLLFESLGFEKVTTYIQSGNVIFKSEARDDLAKVISEKIANKYGFIVHVLVKKASELSEILSKCPFLGEKMVKATSFYCKKNLLLKI